MEALGGNKKTQYEVCEENWQTVLIFTKLWTQWVYTQGVAVGLNYNSVEVLFRLEKVKDRSKVFAGIQIMESAALKIMHSKGSE